MSGLFSGFLLCVVVELVIVALFFNKEEWKLLSTVSQKIKKRFVK